MKKNFKHGILSYVRIFVFIVAIGIIIFFTISFIKQREKIKEDIKNQYINIEYQAMKEKLESTFDTMYESARTISLLPSIRNITGGNRTDGDQDVVELGRFSEDANMTVQQLYNNLSNNVAVSEIYIMTEGLDYEIGEVPFLMYDQFIVKNEEPDESLDDINENATTEVVNNDYPEEAEDAEYAYFPKQMAAFKTSHPVFNFDSLDQIPAAFSESLRTCDNTQYQSISRNNEEDSFGIFYSVPFYDNDDKFKGQVSVIFRDNILEAMLVDVPFLILTEDDITNATEMGFTMPEKPSNYLLTNENYNVSIYDRRNTSLTEKFIDKTYTNDVVAFDLNVTGDSAWTLGFYFDQTMFTADLNNALHSYLMDILAVILFTIILISLLTYYQRSQVRMIDRFAKSIKEVSSGNLNAKLKSSGSDFEILNKEYSTLTGNMKSMIGDIKSVSDTVYFSCNDISALLDVLSNSSKTLMGATDSVLMQVSKLNEMSAEVNASMDSVSNEVENTTKKSLDSRKLIEDVVNSMSTIKNNIEKTTNAALVLEKHSNKVSDLVSLVDSIATQTNILALNASVEATRAGASGSGFKIVSSEMKNLSDETTNTVKIITDVIEQIRAQINVTTSLMHQTVSEVEKGVELSHKANDNILEISEVAHELETNATEIISAIGILHQAVNTITDSGNTVSANVKINDDSIEEVSEIAEELKEMSNKLKNSVAVFKL